jgi:hypothetical protein
LSGKVLAGADKTRYIVGELAVAANTRKANDPDQLHQDPLHIYPRGPVDPETVDPAKARFFRKILTLDADGGRCVGS